MLAGCDDDTVVAPVPRIQVATDASTYVRSSDEVHPTLANLSDQPVYLLTCSQTTRLEVSEAGAWKDLGTWYPPCLSPGGGNSPAPSVPYAVEPGTFVDLPWIPTDYLAGLDPGTYRVRVLVYSNNKAPYLPLPDAQQVSEPFQVTD